MTRITLCAAKGSPGVTTLACVLGAVWPPEREVVVAECDPSGGDLAGRFGLSTRLGLTSLILTERHREVQGSDHRAHTQSLPGGLEVLVAPSGADSAMALDRELGRSTSAIVSWDCDLLADCGRLIPGAIGQEKMIRTADRVILLVRPELAAIAHARWAMNRIRDLEQSHVSVLVAGSGDFTVAEISEELDVAVLGVIPFDARAALMACGATGTAKEFVRSGLIAFARDLVAALTQSPPAVSQFDRDTAIYDDVGPSCQEPNRSRHQAKISRRRRIRSDEHTRANSE